MCIIFFLFYTIRYNLHPSPLSFLQLLLSQKEDWKEADVKRKEDKKQPNLCVRELARASLACSVRQEKCGSQRVTLKLSQILTGWERRESERSNNLFYPFLRITSHCRSFFFYFSLLGASFPKLSLKTSSPSSPINQVSLQLRTVVIRKPATTGRNGNKREREREKKMNSRTILLSLLLLICFIVSVSVMFSWTLFSVFSTPTTPVFSPLPCMPHQHWLALHLSLNSFTDLFF